MPNFNWRDRFEDLLALESGNRMISAVSRQNEAVTAFRVRSESVHDDISHVNQQLQQYHDYRGLLLGMREIALRRKHPDIVSLLDNAMPGHKRHAETVVANGKALIGSLKDLENKPASIYKGRVPWITSLISSGAMLGWESAVCDSADGWLADVYKADGSRDGQIFSELDLDGIFREGRPLGFRTPSWSTYHGSYGDFSYTDIEELCPDGDADPDAVQTYDAIENIRPSIISQLTKVQQKKSWNGSIETRVVLKNRFSNGDEAEKTIVDDAPKVLEEVEKFHTSIKERHRSIRLALWNLEYTKQEEILIRAKELEDEG